MRRLLLTASLPLAALVFTGVTTNTNARLLFKRTAAQRNCGRLFTVRKDERAARAVYRGTRTATLANLRLLGYLERCQRNPKAQSFTRWFNRHQRALQRERQAQHRRVLYLNRLERSMSYATASWYDDSSGRCASPAGCSTYGVANKTLAFGTHVLFAYHGRSVEAVVDDRGPFVAGREWDLDQHVAAALGFSGVDTVGFRLMR